MSQEGYLNNIKELVAGKKVCIFPMGVGGRTMFERLQPLGIEIDFFCDNNKELWGTEYKGKTCISYPELLACNKEMDLVVIVESSYYKSIKQQLLQDGVQNIHRIYLEKIDRENYWKNHKEEVEEKVERILQVCEDEKSRQVYRHIFESWKMNEIPDDYFEKICSLNQYFDTDVVSLRENEVFVDLGAYTGDTAEQFMEACKGNYEKMHLFEMDLNIYIKLLRQISSLSDSSLGVIQCYPYGISEKHEKIDIIVGDGNSTINKQSSMNVGNEKIQAELRTLDELLYGERVTFIKMDIEGAELGALKGAKGIIEEQKPILAICIYHSAEDMLNIPIYIKENYPDYQIYIRHYSELMFDTICYAIPQN